MKPISLTLQCFGPYLEKTIINFDDFENSLTLVSGNTGSGKTTLFDAISCALFGETSGKNRDFSEMRTKSAKPSDTTYIKFKFELKGQTYQIERRPKYLRPKLRGEGFTNEESAANLYMPDGSCISKKGNVDRKIKDLLGIESSQFREICMIAQNDFMAMIKETDANQEKIFNKIFKADLFKNFDKKIKEKTKSSLEKQNILLNELRVRLDNLKFLNIDQNEENIISILETTEKYYKQRIEDRDKYISLRREKEKNLEQLKLKEQEELQKQEKYKALELEKKSLNSLLYQEDRYKQLEEELTLAEKARDQVDPIYRSCLDLENRKATIEKNYLKKREEYKQNKKKTEIAEKKKSELSEENLKKQKVALELLEAKSKDYDTAQSLEKEINTFNKDLDKLQKTIKEFKENLTKNTDLLNTIEIKEDATFSLRLAHLKEEEKTVKQVKTFLDELEKLLKSVYQEYENLETVSKSVVVAHEDYLKASRIYDNALDNYIKDQSFFIAQRLKENEPCPVCGSLEHPHPAKEDKIKVTQEELDKLLEERNVKDTQSRELKQQEQQVVAVLRENQNLIEHTLNSLKNIDKNKEFVKEIEESLESLFKIIRDKKQKLEINNIETAIIKYKQDLNIKLINISSENSTLETERKNNLKLIDTKKNLEERIDKDKQREHELETEIKTLATKAHERDKILQNLLKNLEYKDKATFTKILNKKRNETLSYEKDYLEAKAIHETCMINEERIKGEGLALSEELKKSKENLEEIKTTLDNKLKETEFNTLEKFLEYKKDAQSINKLSSTIREYKNKILVSKQNIKIYEEELRDKEILDLKKIKEEIEKVSTEIETLDNNLKPIEYEIGVLKSNTTDLKKLEPKLEEAKRTYNMFYHLDSVINKRGENFTQFVLSIYFQKVLEKANEKLYVMTDGEYELRQTQEGQLDISVFDNNTGEIRSIKTLSGGETFVASLALALGFSEVVEEENGGIRLDTIFIDEGFGSLDSNYLDRALDVLSRLTNDRNVYIISHVGELKERIKQQIVVNKNNKGSFISIKK